MTKPIRSIKNAARYLSKELDEELRRLRLKVEQLQEQVRNERRRADQHADEIALLREQEAVRIRRASWGNGVSR